MTTLENHQDDVDGALFRVLYVGTEAGQTEDILSRVESSIGFRQVSAVADAMKTARTMTIDWKRLPCSQLASSPGCAGKMK